MDRATFDRFSKLVYQKSGITLSPEKEALVSARIGKRMRELSLEAPDAYLQVLLKDASGEELVRFLDAISTNVTSFYRESDHFDFLAKVMAQWAGEGQTRFRIWCAAASTGEEPYTIAMTALEALKGQRADLRILATDISTRVLDHCRSGSYDEEKVKPIPAALRDKYFDRMKEEGRTSYTPKPALRSLFVFKRLNLSTPPFPMQGPMDVVFCRNVMIYFDNAVRSRLLAEITRLLKPGGYLMVAHSESLAGMLCDLETVRPSVYMKPA